VTRQEKSSGRGSANPRIPKKRSPKKIAHDLLGENALQRRKKKNDAENRPLLGKKRDHRLSQERDLSFLKGRRNCKADGSAKEKYISAKRKKEGQIFLGKKSPGQKLQDAPLRKERKEKDSAATRKKEVGQGGGRPPFPPGEEKREGLRVQRATNGSEGDLEEKKVTS